MAKAEADRIEPEDACTRANELSSKRCYEEAVQILDRVLSVHPANLNALLTKGTILTTAGRLPEARVALVETLTLDPKNVGALQTLALVESALGEHERALSLFRQLASHKGLDEGLARMIGNQMWALDETGRNSSVFKDIEEGCPPIEQVIAEVEKSATRDAQYNPTTQAEIIERLSRQIAAQTSVLGRLDNMQNFYDYTLTQQRFRNMAMHSYQKTTFKAPNDPPRDIPEAMRSAFSMDGRIEILQGYVNSALPLECTEGIDDSAVRTLLALNYESLPSSAKPQASRILEDFVAIAHSQMMKTFDRRTPNAAFGKMPVLHPMPLPEVELGDKSVAVVGSADYYVDAILTCLCRELTSVRLRHARGATALFKTAFLFEWLREDSQYDLIICPSILDNLGLGRHGEPLDPDADIGLMRRFREKLGPSGAAYVQLPVGRDRLIFNTMRIYGAHRLPTILEGWRPDLAAFVKADQLTARVPVRENFLLEPK
jgi:tetratricopeptide (TPR) repeat protein